MTCSVNSLFFSGLGWMTGLWGYVNLNVPLVDMFTHLRKEIMWANEIYKKLLLEVNIS